MKAIKTILAAACLMSGIAVLANGDPVVEFSSINRVANPEPFSISEIIITREIINISHVDSYNCFDVTYTFKNESDKNFPKINYGFPIDYTVADEHEIYQLVDADQYSESMVETGWNKSLIKDVAFTFNDKSLSFHSSKESVCQAGFSVETYGDEADTTYIAGINRRWHYTSFAMEPNSEATFNVRYKVYANSSFALGTDHSNFSYYAQMYENGEYTGHVVSFASRYFIDNFSILYDFTPAKHFGDGKAYRTDVNIDLSNLNNAFVTADGGYHFYADRIEKYFFSSPREMEPVKLKVYFESDRSEKQVRQFIEQFQIPGKDYTVKSKANAVTIEFPTPKFVSEIACDLDTTNLRGIDAVVEYNDGHQKHFRYETKDISDYNMADTRIKSPVLLTITDMYHTLNPRYTNNPATGDPSADKSSTDETSANKTSASKTSPNETKPQIKRIRLSFNSPNSNPLKSLTPLDSRP